MTIHVAIPAMNEAEFIDKTLECIKSQQTASQINTYVCVNQPESYWHNSDKELICENNKRTIDILEKSELNNLKILDKSSMGHGWDEKKHGVGIARKTLMDFIAKDAKNDDIVISLDADTTFGAHYFQSVADQFLKFPNAVAMSNPYYHQLTGKNAEDKAILRYEIYMRNYAIQMLRIKSPFAFTALGSALGYKIKSYKAIGGMSPMKSGEDFYFLQQLRKYGEIIIHNSQKVFPAARFSDRVFFGTGPAMIKGNSGDWNSYPIYHSSLFEEIRKVYLNISNMYKNIDYDTLEFLEFLKQQFGTNDFLTPIRQNFKTEAQFNRAFYTKVDGLRALQYLKKEQQNREIENRISLLNNYPSLSVIDDKYLSDCLLEDFSVEDLATIREELVSIEGILIEEKQTLS
ncbi:MAG: hypothetical protein WCP69_03300 [Bacteroidota bacterium]